MQFKLQKLDRRMTGHRYYQYRVEFTMSAVRGIEIPGLSVYAVKTQLFSEIMQSLCQALGFGSYVDYTQYAKDPKWAFRIADHNHVDTIYLTEEARVKYEEIITFLTLKYSG